MSVGFGNTYTIHLYGYVSVLVMVDRLHLFSWDLEIGSGFRCEESTVLHGHRRRAKLVAIGVCDAVYEIARVGAGARVGFCVCVCKVVGHPRRRVSVQERRRVPRENGSTVDAV